MYHLTQLLVVSGAFSLYTELHRVYVARTHPDDISIQCCSLFDGAESHELQSELQQSPSNSAPSDRLVHGLYWHDTYMQANGFQTVHVLNWRSLHLSLFDSQTWR